MEAKKQLLIFNPYTIIPSYGENKVNLIYNNSELEVSIFYDALEHDCIEKAIILLFKHVCFHKFTSFPGVSDSVIKFEDNNELSSLVEFEYSDFKIAWEKHFNNLFKLRHFRFFFTSANHYLEVICEDLEIKT